MTASRHQDSASKLMDPQQREDQLKAAKMDDINRMKAAKLAAKKKKIAAKGGKISKDADFEKMFGKDIDEFLEDSEWDIESMDKMSQFSKNSKHTIRSAAQAGKLRGLEKLYLQRIETSMNKNTLQMTGNISQGTAGPAGQGKKSKAAAGNKFREFQDRYGEETGSNNGAGPARAKQAWDTGSRMSKNSRASNSKSLNRVFKAKK